MMFTLYFGNESRDMQKKPHFCQITLQYQSKCDHPLFIQFDLELTLTPQKTGDLSIIFANL